MKKFAVFDLDGTLIRWQLYHAVADQLAKLGHFNANDYEAVRMARMNWKKRDNQDSFKTYEHQLIALVDSAITHISPTVLIETSKTVLDEYKDQTYTYTRNLISKLKQNDYMLFAISASHTETVELLANYYGFDDFGGSIYEIKNGKFTGRKQVLKRERKPEYLKELVAKYGLTYKDSIGVGDSESDIAMLEMVEQPIAFNPTKLLFDHAKAAEWKIVVERKNVIYELNSGNGSYILA